jgi:tRNA pseudouridine38-40 synthase
MTSEGSHRICLTVQYDGGAFFGWQLQREERSVQGELERVLGRLFDRPARVLGSGRTDRGVHATGQVASVDAPGALVPGELRRALNAPPPGESGSPRRAPVPPRFHPRYDAVSRSYIYRVGSPSRAPRPSTPLVLAAAQASTAADGPGDRHLVGDHSFRAFAKAGQEERGDRCIVRRPDGGPWPSLGLEFHISANRFLHHMVRYSWARWSQLDSGAARRPTCGLLSREGGLLTSPPAPPEGLFPDRRHLSPPFGPDRIAKATQGDLDLPISHLIPPA